MKQVLRIHGRGDLPAELAAALLAGGLQSRGVQESAAGWDYPITLVPEPEER
jgi:hypothetical protein